MQGAQKKLFKIIVRVQYTESVIVLLVSYISELDLDIDSDLPPEKTHSSVIK